jgi:hypothetical protein
MQCFLGGHTYYLVKLYWAIRPSSEFSLLSLLHVRFRRFFYVAVCTSSLLLHSRPPLYFTSPSLSLPLPMDGHPSCLQLSWPINQCAPFEPVRKLCVLLSGSRNEEHSTSTHPFCTAAPHHNGEIRKSWSSQRRLHTKPLPLLTHICQRKIQGSVIIWRSFSTWAFWIPERCKGDANSIGNHTQHSDKGERAWVPQGHRGTELPYKLWWPLHFCQAEQRLTEGRLWSQTALSLTPDLGKFLPSVKMVISGSMTEAIVRVK